MTQKTTNAKIMIGDMLVDFDYLKWGDVFLYERPNGWFLCKMLARIDENTVNVEVIAK